MTSHRIYTLTASAAAGAALFACATGVTLRQATTGDFYTVIAYSPSLVTRGGQHRHLPGEGHHVALGNCQQRGDGCGRVVGARWLRSLASDPADGAAAGPPTQTTLKPTPWPRSRRAASSNFIAPDERTGATIRRDR